jgi:predicted P-loop ATPase
MSQLDEHYGAKVEIKETRLLKTMKLLRNHDDLKGSFRLNLFTKDIEHARNHCVFNPIAKEGDLLSDIDVNCLMAWWAKSYTWVPSAIQLNAAIIDVAMDSKYHPVKDYLEKLRWDSQHRLDNWLTEICGVERTPYTESVGRKIFVAMVQRIYEPGCQFDNMLILEGQQGIYKSSLVRAIGGLWYAPIELNVNDRKSLVEVMRGKWILEVEELAGFKKQEVDKVKSFLSCPSDRVRLSFGHHCIDFKRQCVFIATYNPEGLNTYLSDIQNRRFWPISIPENFKIKLTEFNEIRDQLFAEALYWYHKGEKLFIDGEEAAELALEEQAKRRSIDPWTTIILDWIKHRNVEKVGISTPQIAIECLGMRKEFLTSGVYRRIAGILKEARFCRRQGKNRDWLFFKERDGQDGTFEVCEEPFREDALPQQIDAE